MAGLNTEKAAPAGLVLLHYAVGAVMFLLLTFLMIVSSDSFVGHFFNPRILAVTHMATLGWATMIIFGALYQFVPVVLVADLYSTALAKITLACFVSGISVLVYSFWNFSVGISLEVAAVLLFTGASIFLLNISETSRRARQDCIEGQFIVTAAVWFWLTVLLGALMAFNFTHPFLPMEHLHYLRVHAHIGVAGWFLMLIIGVSVRLIPMFLLSSAVSRKPLIYAYYIINIALLAFLTDAMIFGGMNRSLIYFFLVLAGLIFYCYFVLQAYRKRGRKLLDIGMKQSMTAFILIGVPLVSGVVINYAGAESSRLMLQVTMAYGASIFLGFISLLILGQTFKTLPFIVWLKLNRIPHGTARLPLPKNMFSERRVRLQFIIYSISVLILLIGILTAAVIIIRVGAVGLCIAAVLYNISVFRLIFFRVASDGSPPGKKTI